MSHLFIQHLLVAEAWLVLCAALFALLRRRAPGIVVPLALLVVCAATLFSAGGAPFSGWAVPPGSFLTRFELPVSDPSVRRAIEPALISLIALLAVAAGGCFRAAAITLSGVAVLESVSRDRAIAPLVPAATPVIVTLLALLSAVLTAVSLVRPGKELPIRGRLPLAVALITVPLCVLLAARSFAPVPRGPLVGAHYYAWFPENWAGSFIGEKMVPPVLPELGLYRSRDADVVRAHVGGAREAGIDFFILDWWLKRRELKRKVLEIADMMDREGMQYAIHLETLDLDDKTGDYPPDEPAEVRYLSPRRVALLCTHLQFVAKRLITRKGYLRFAGRPVVFFYSTRHLVGPVASAMAAARTCVRDVTGEEPYFVGDEVFFNVIDHDASRGFFLRPEGDPQWSRLSAFDAVTSYNPFDPTRPHHGGTRSVDSFLADVARLFDRYARLASAAGAAFVPSVIPGYNDRGVRPAAGHAVIPRFPGDGGEPFFARALRRWIAPHASHAPFIVVTSWNEWNEGTQIEPARESARTVEDVSGRRELSAGEVLAGYQRTFLRLLSSFRASGWRDPSA